MTINHNAETMEGTLNMSTKELIAEVDKTQDIASDLQFYLACYRVSQGNDMLAMTLNKLTGLELDAHSKVAEYMVKQIIDTEDREDFVREAMASMMVKRLLG